LKHSGCHFDAILIQETWLNENSDTNRFHIDNYTLITKPCQTSSHGGLAIYIHNNISYKVLDKQVSPSNIWEGQFLEIALHRKCLILGNVYRPPRDVNENYYTFIEEFNNCLKDISDEALIGGDFNIDLLRINEKQVISEYFDSVVSSGFIPKITLPTRLSKTRGSLIDNFRRKSQIIKAILFAWTF